SQVEIHVLQGERPMAADNKSLGRFILDGIPPAPRGVPQIEVTFDIDANGILNVSARDKATGREQKITITASSGLTEAEIERMVKDAEAHAAEDAKRREQAEVKNQAEAAVFRTEQFLREYNDRLPADGKQEAERKIAAVRSALEGSNPATIRSATNDLEQYIQTLGARMYSAENPAGAASAAGSSANGKGKSGEDVVDAEFTEA
ncbi:MAG: molecular chaperone DnaK, partial [Phototrophicales bacterium]